MITLLIFIAVMASLVLVHEFGHFIVARKCGVKAEEFGLGFPPRLWSWQGKETLYTINLIPLGGFVRLKGEAGEHKKDKDSFAGKKPWQRALIISAGVIMNAISAWIFISLALAIGVPTSLDGQDFNSGAKIRDVGIRIESVLENSPAEKALIEPGDVVVAIDNVHFEAVEDIQKYIDQHGGYPLLFTFKRNDQPINIRVTPEQLPQLHRFGVGIALVKSGIISYPAHLAAVEGLKRTGYIGKEIVMAFYKIIATLVTGHAPEAQLSGPVAIAVVTGQVAKLGLAYLLQFMAILSVNLAIMNFIPFPALDGGRMLFLIIEKFRGRPVGKKLEAYVHNIGFTALMLLMIFVTINDIQKYGSAVISAVFNSL